MFPPQKLRYEPRTVVDYRSPYGARIVQIRAIVFKGQVELLKTRGEFEDYMACLAPEYRDQVVGSLASSWLPIEALSATYDAIERILASDTQIVTITEPLGARIFDNLFGTIVRAVRSMGTEAGIWAGFRQADRVFSRIYQGGACRVRQVGPKDAWVQIQGLPRANSRCSRLVHCSFLRGVFATLTKTCVVKCESVQDHDPDRLTLLISWV